MTAPENPPPTVTDLLHAARHLVLWLEWDKEVIEDFHAYAQMFHRSKGGANAFMLAFEDALRSRGLTLEQFRAMVQEGIR